MSVMSDICTKTSISKFFLGLQPHIPDGNGTALPKTLPRGAEIAGLDIARLDNERRSGIWVDIAGIDMRDWAMHEWKLTDWTLAEGGGRVLAVTTKKHACSHRILPTLHRYRILCGFRFPVVYTPSCFTKTQQL